MWGYTPVRITGIFVLLVRGSLFHFAISVIFANQKSVLPQLNSMFYFELLMLMYSNRLIAASVFSAVDRFTN